MDTRDILITALNDAHRMGDIALAELTPEVAHYEAGGTTNSIAQLLAHMTTGEDGAINRVAKGGTRLIELKDWAAETGIPTERGAIWTKDWRLNIDAFTQYREAVKASANEYLANLSADELEREVEWFSGPRPLHSLLQIIVIHHTLGHSGEISTLKGMQGLKGLPF
jgi:uncharacterized damage-inducible protein DinB